MTLIQWKAGKSVVWDVTATCITIDSCIREAGAAAEIAQNGPVQQSGTTVVRARGLPQQSLNDVYRAMIQGKFLYAACMVWFLHCGG